MSKFTNQETYTVKAAAARARVDVRTITRWLEGGMPFRKVAGMIFIDHEDLTKRMQTGAKVRKIRAKRKETL